MRIEDVVETCLEVNAGITSEALIPQPSQESVFCAMCPDEPALAEFLCLTCSGLALCLGCKNKHLQRLKQHTAVALEESKDAMCTKHPDKRVEFCCDSPCHELICSACGLLDHAGHKFCELPKAAERERVELQRVADGAVEAAGASVTALAALLDDLLAHVAGLHGLVATEGEKLIQLVRQKMTEAHAAIDSKVAPQLQRLKKAKEAARDVAGRVCSCAAVARRVQDPERCSHAEVYRLAPVRGWKTERRVGQQANM
jgi:hypothetical protein